MTKYIIAALAGVVAALVITIFIPPEPAPTSGRKANVSRREAEARDRIDALIKGLRSPNPEDRAIFHRNLIEETGMFFEFKPAALPEEREAAFRRWEEWWSVNRDKTREQWLIDSLSLEDYGGKPLTFKKLVEMSSQASVPAIIAILDDPQPLLRADAVRALGRLAARPRGRSAKSARRKRSQRWCAPPARRTCSPG